MACEWRYVLAIVASTLERPPQLESDYIGAKRVGVLKTRLGENITINHTAALQGGGGGFQELAKRDLVDCVIADTEDGFSPLGLIRRFLSDDLGLVERDLVKYILDGFPDNLEKDISSLADWNRFKNPEVTLVAVPSERKDGHLRGLILAPYWGSECYKQYANQWYGKPHRDFAYNVTYEAIAYAYETWNARRIGISPMCFHRDWTTCQVEAMAHFCNDNSGMESFTFANLFDGTCEIQLLEIVNSFNDMQDIGDHRGIITKAKRLWGIDFVNLDWSIR